MHITRYPDYYHFLRCGNDVVGNVVVGNDVAGNMAPLQMPTTNEELDQDIFDLGQLLDKQAHLERICEREGIDCDLMSPDQEMDFLVAGSNKRNILSVAQPAFMIVVFQGGKKNRTVKYTIRYVALLLFFTSSLLLYTSSSFFYFFLFTSLPTTTTTMIGTALRLMA